VGQYVSVGEEEPVGKNIYNTFNEYLEDQTPRCKEYLQELRHIILEVIPEAEELCNYNIPAFTLVPGGKREEQIMIAGYKNHVGLYPHPTTIKQFDSRLTSYKRGKGSVQFPLDKPLPKALIIEMISFRLRYFT